MSKPQVASEPTLEEILASIRKMIADDKPGPRPLPGPMGRTLFGDSSRTTPDAEARDGEDDADQAVGGAAPAPNFNSLADALKVATTLSDQRRSLQQDIASALEKGPRGNLDALMELSAPRAETHSVPETRGEAAPAPAGGLENSFDRRSEAPAAGEGKRDLLSFDFGAVVPKRDSAQAKPQPEVTDPTPAVVHPAADTDVKAAAEAVTPKADVKAAPASESRVLPLRTAGGASAGIVAASLNVSPFPRPLREPSKAAEEAAVPAADKATEPSAKPEAAGPPSEPVRPEPSASIEEAVKEQTASQAESLLDAVVELVQQEPGALSVFTSGASFISGVSGKPEAAATTLPAVVVSTGEAGGVGGAPKLDRAAAELLRPMLRQWLADNMPRIVEEALRSELSEQTQGGKGPGKA